MAQKHSQATTAAISTTLGFRLTVIYVYGTRGDTESGGRRRTLHCDRGISLSQLFSF